MLRTTQHEYKTHQMGIDIQSSQHVLQTATNKTTNISITSEFRASSKYG